MLLPAKDGRTDADGRGHTHGRSARGLGLFPWFNLLSLCESAARARGSPGEESERECETLIIWSAAVGAAEETELRRRQRVSLFEMLKGDGRPTHLAMNHNQQNEIRVEFELQRY